MTSTAVLRTPPASTSRRNDYISLRPPRGGKEKDLRREASLSPTISMQRVKSPPERSFGDSPSQPSPSPLSRRVLFERGSNRQYDSDDDDDDEPSPSLTRLHSPFASHCASPFLGAWASHGSQPTPSGQPIEDDEGPFLISKAKTTPRNHTHPAVPRNASSRTPSFAKLIFTPSAPQKQALVTLSPLRRVSRPRAPQTPAETEWHLGRQTDSMKKLSIGEDDHLGRQPKYQVTNSSTKDQESSPSPISRRRGRKRLFNGNELPRASGGIFETLVDTPVASSFHIPEPPSPTTRLKSSTDAIFGPPAHTSPGSYIKSPPLNITLTGSPAVTPVRNSSPKLTLDLIAKKYRPRDSGIGGLDGNAKDEDTLDLLPSKPDKTFYSGNLEDPDLITPSLEPSFRSAWPTAAFPQGRPDEVDEFIFKALAAGAAPPKDKKVMPGTPVKRNAYAHSRPWVSSSKVMPPPGVPHAGGAPRKSLPVSFPNLSQIQDSPDGSDTSPSDRTFAHRRMYGDVGKGRPSVLPSRGGSSPHTPDTTVQLMLRRSSSGAFSSSSSEGSMLGTPTKLPVPQCRLPARPTTTGVTSMKRPTYNRPNIYDQGYRVSPRRSFNVLPRPLTEHERPNKFEVDFITVETLGTGEFGSVLKARYKQGNKNDVFAVKMSKRFEGVKHRHQLREEVDVLQHLALTGGARGHPNVLKYIDSWEQNDALYIQTELCELGNFGTFLAEYGTHFEALDEARVWKICAELSSGLRFIHGAGVIHLDLKPANIFVTAEGRFRIGDFGMASLWPRHGGDDSFEREGDREYMAPEVLQGHYGKAADIFSFGMIMLETAANIVVPDMGDDWRRLREDDFSAVDFGTVNGDACAHPRSAELVTLICQMMRSNPAKRLMIEHVYEHAVVRRAREAMVRKVASVTANGGPVFGASPLGGEPDGFVEKVLQIRRSTNTMDLSP